MLRSLRDGDCFDTPPQPVERYQVQKVESPLSIRRFNQKCRTIPAGKVLRVETLAPATMRWTADDWRTAHDTRTEDSGVGMHFADLRTRKLRDGSVIVFTFLFLWTESQEWQNANFQVKVGGTGAAP